MPHRTFEETQRFNQVWIWAILIVVCLFVLIQLTIALIGSTESEPVSTETIVALVIAFFILIGVNVLFYSMRLNTKINDDGVTITFKPLINRPKQFAWKAIEKAFVRKYKPIWEYGGWGIRHRLSGRAYNTSGNMGLQLIMKSGKKILIGTQKPKELENFLKKYIFTDLENY